MAVSLSFPVGTTARIALPGLQTGGRADGAAENCSGREFGQKKTRTLPSGPGKFWERMPERPDPFAARRSFSQVRKAQRWLQNLQVLRNVAGIRSFWSKIPCRSGTDPRVDGRILCAASWMTGRARLANEDPTRRRRGR